MAYYNLAVSLDPDQTAYPTPFRRMVIAKQKLPRKEPQPWYFGWLNSKRRSSSIVCIIPRPQLRVFGLK